MQDCKPCGTPMTSGISLTNEGEMFSDPSFYKTNVNSLQYLTYTWADIAFVVNKLSQFPSSPKQQHWLACKRLSRYLKGTINLGLVFTPSPKDLSLTIYTDADHVRCKVTKRSTNGLCVFFSCNLLIWGFRKQLVVVRLVGETKYRVVAQG